MLLLLCTALCLRFLFRRADHVPGGVRHVFASPAWPLRLNGLFRRGNERPPCCRVAARAQSHSCAAGPAGQRHPQPDQHTQHTQHFCRHQTGYGPSVPATPVAALVRVVSPIVTATVVSKLWPDAASVLVTATVAPTLAATFDSAASTRSGAIPAASMVCADGASAAPVHCAALHRGQ